MTLVERINQEIKEAMRSKNQLRLETLRMLKAKILAADARSNLADEEVVKLFKAYAGNLQEALEQAIAVKREEMAQKLKIELAIVQQFLPKPLSSEEVKALVEQAIAETGAVEKKELGTVMKKVISLNPAVDGKVAKEWISLYLK